MSKAETLRRLIVGDLQCVFRQSYGATLPDDDAGRDDLELLLGPLSLCRNAPVQKMMHAIEVWAPWLASTEAQELIDQIMRLPACARRLSGKELGERLNLTNAQRERWKVWRIVPVDMTADDLKEQRKAKDRARKAIQRHEAGATPHERSLSRRKPWEAEGIGRRQWERRRAKSHVAICSATILLKARNKLRHAPTKLKRPKLARGTLCSPRNQNGKGQRMTKDPLSPRPSSTPEQPASQEATAWSELDWANMSPDEVTATLAAMEAEFQARRPGVEARRAGDEAAAEARLIDAFRSHMRQWAEADGHLTMAERNARQREADARL